MQIKFVIILTIALVPFIECKNSFTFFASKYVRKGEDYFVAISSFGVDGHLPFDFSIVYKLTSDSGEESYHRDDDDWSDRFFFGDGTVHDSIKFLHKTTNDYYLQLITAENGTDVIRRQKLTILPKREEQNRIVLIQTDKSIYRPSDKIQFRVIFLKADMKPLRLGTNNKVKVQISDGARNNVKQFDVVTSYEGVYQNEIQLSDMPNMGSWNIRVIIEGKETKTKTVEVAGLPEFVVTINSSPHVTFGGGKIVANVKARYSSGKSVKGSATISVKVSNNTLKEKVVQVEDETSVEFDIQDDLKLIESDAETSVLLFARFKDELTGHEEDASATVKIHKTLYYMQLEATDDLFKPGLPFSVNATLKYHNKDAPFVDNQNPVVFTIKYFNEKSELMNADTKNVNIVDGVATVDIPSLQPNVKKFTVSAGYLEASKITSEIEKAHSASNKYLRILRPKGKLDREELEVFVSSTEELSTMNCIAFNDEKIFYASTALVNYSKEKVYRCYIITRERFKLEPVTIVAYYVTSDGEVVYDSISLDFNVELENYLNFEFSSNQTKPGKDIENYSIVKSPSKTTNNGSRDWRDIFSEIISFSNLV